MYQNLSLQGKLLSLSCIMAFLLLAVGADGYWSLSQVSKLYGEVAEVQLPNVATIADLEADEKSIVIELHALQDSKAGSAEFRESVKTIAEDYASIEKGVKAYEALPFGPGEEDQWKKTKPALEKAILFSHQMLALYESNEASARKEVDHRMGDELPAIQKTFQTNFDKSQEIILGIAHHAADEAKHISEIAHVTVTIGALIGVLVSLLLGFFIARALSKTMMDIAARLMNGSQEVASATRSIAEAGTELSASATEQAAALQQTVASLEEVSAMVSKSADNARRSLETSAKSQDAATKGKQAVQEVIGSIEEINRSNGEIMGQVEESNREIAEIVKVIGEIGNKTKVINDIVFQTKLLSFNASVEAARAGEHGKGFAVVAEEVGNLAQMSGNAAKEISGMLEDSIRKVQGIADKTKANVEKLVVVGREKVEAGSATATRCAGVLDEIVTNVSLVNQMVEEISTACREQAQGVQEINKAMGQLDQVTQQNSAAAQQSATASEQLRGQTTDLDSVVQNLHRTIQGGNGHAPMTAATTLAAKKPTAQVIPLRSPSLSPARTEMAPKAASRPASKAKRVVGGDDVPSESDPRFEDV